MGQLQDLVPCSIAGRGHLSLHLFNLSRDLNPHPFIWKSASQTINSCSFVCAGYLSLSICLWMNRRVQVCACINVVGCVSQHMSTSMMVSTFTKPCMHLYPHLGAADTTNLHSSPPHRTKQSLPLSSCLELCPPPVWKRIKQQQCLYLFIDGLYSIINSLFFIKF